MVDGCKHCTQDVLGTRSRLAHPLCLSEFGIHTLLLGEACIAAAKTFAHGPNGIRNGIRNATLSTCWEHALLRQSFDVSSQYPHHREFLACALSMVQYLVQVRHCGLPHALHDRIWQPWHKKKKNFPRPQQRDRVISNTYTKDKGACSVLQELVRDLCVCVYPSNLQINVYIYIHNIKIFVN